MSKGQGFYSSEKKRRKKVVSRDFTEGNTANTNSPSSARGEEQDAQTADFTTLVQHKKRPVKCVDFTGRIVV